MESWTLQGDSYSFLRSAPRNVSLCHRDGTPNHVEIFDIINVASQRSAISETTCLCDIFGDDCESPSLSTNPAAETFVLSKTIVDGTAAASPLVDDLNDSSGSYHSAQAFSEGEEVFVDSRERLCSTQLQNDLPEGRQFAETCSKLQQITASQEEPVTKERTQSSGSNTSTFFSSEKRLSSSSSSLLEKRCSSILPNSELDANTTTTSTTTSLHRHRSPLQHSETPSPSLNAVECVNSPCIQTENLGSEVEFGIEQDSQEPRSNFSNRHSGLTPVLTSKNYSHFTELVSDSESIHSSLLPLPCGTEVSFQSRETPVSPELINRSCTPDTQASSPFPELRRRISLPDLFSRCSTPDIEDSFYSTKQISNLSTTERDRTSPESQGAHLSAEPASTSSTPAPRYTPPSPVVSIQKSPELRESRASSQLSHIATSPGPLRANSPATLETRSPSPGLSHTPRLSPLPSEISSHVSSPAASHSLSPSPGLLNNCSPTEHKFTSPSPEIRITASSPDLSRAEQSTVVHAPSLSPLSTSGSGSSFTSSPHITGIFCSVVQPEERISPPFPELSNFSTTEPERTQVCPGSGSPTPFCGSPTSSDCKPQESPSIFNALDTDVQTEIEHQARYQTPSPHQHYSPSSNYPYPTASGDYTNHLSQRSEAASPVGLHSKQICNQQQPANFSSEINPEVLNSKPSESKTASEIASIDITKTQYPIHFDKESISTSIDLDKSDVSVIPEIKSRSPVEVVPSPVLTSHCIAVESVQSLLEQQIIVSEVTSHETGHRDNSIIAALSEDKFIYPTLDQENNLFINTKSVSPNLVYKENSSRHHFDRSTSKPFEDKLEKKYHQTSENNTTLKLVKTPEHKRKNRQTNTKCKNSVKLTEDMAHYVKRRRTPSPPITRFTPVHIIAPEKPSRQWQQRSRSHSQIEAASASGNLKTAVTNRESPNVAPDDNNRQDHWVRHGMQFETEREMQLEVDGETGRERLMDMEMEGERQREEQLLEKGKGWQEEASYRGEQLELSFSDRNRKAPASHTAARTSREPSQALPTVHSYSESLLDTKQKLQQQTPGPTSQQDTRCVPSGRRFHPPAPQNRKGVPRRVATNRHCQSSSSSMGSEFDDADNEVKWFTDLAFHSLSSPEVDYLDMYNSSHRSSTNISQQSTLESPAGVGAALLAYADFKGSASKLDSEQSGQSAKYSDGLEPSKRFELGSFECIDVAMEREDSRKVRRGVPKRQIQLKRKDNTDEEQNANRPRGVTMESISVESPSRDTLLRQHSTPAAIQECLSTDCAAELDQHAGRISKLQKSASLDESFNKNKMATCLIKNVLSKKMQSVDKQDQAQDYSPAFEENSLDNLAASDGEYSKPDTNNLSSSLQSDNSSLSDGLFRRVDSNCKDDAKPPKSSAGRSSNRPSSSNSSRSVNFSQTDSEEGDSLSKDSNALRSERGSKLKLPLDTKESRSGILRADDRKTWDRREGSDTANAAARKSEATVAASSGQTALTNSVQECDNTEGDKQVLEGDKSSNASKTEKIPLNVTDKSKTAINVCLTSEAENKNLVSSPDTVNSNTEREGDVAIEDKMNDETNGNNQYKVPIHKVRDVRRLVKNTYNLTFKAPSAASSSNVDNKITEKVSEDAKVDFLACQEDNIKKEIRRNENIDIIGVEKIVKQKENKMDSLLLRSSSSSQINEILPSHLQPMQIEYKAVCWKEDKNKTSCSTKDSEKQGDRPQTSSKHCTEVHKDSLTSSTTNKQIYAAEPQLRANARSCQHNDPTTFGSREQMAEIQKVVNNDGKPVTVKRERKPPMLGSLPKQSSKEREVSTAVVLIRDGSSKIKTSASAAQEKAYTMHQNSSVSHLPTPAIPCSVGHSVSMLIKEKGYQADIGSVMGDKQNTGGAENVACKHVNSLEIPLQTTTSSDVGCSQPDNKGTFAASTNVSKSLAVAGSPVSVANSSKDIEMKSNPALRERGKLKSSLSTNTQAQTPHTPKHKELSDFESVKRQDPTFPPKSPSMRRFRPQPIEVKSVSKEVPKQDTSSIFKASNKARTIEFKSVVKNSLKPVVPPKPSCKFKPEELGVVSNEGQRPSAAPSTLRLQCEDKPQTIVVSSPTIYRKIPSDSTSALNYTRKLSVSAVSSFKAPLCTAAEPAITDLPNQPKVPSEVEPLIDRGQLQEPAAPSSSSNHSQKTLTIAATTVSPTGPTSNSASGSASFQETNIAPVSMPAQVSQISRSPVLDPKQTERQYPTMARPNEQPIMAHFNTGKPSALSTAQVSGYSHPPYLRSFSGERSQRMDNLQFYTSDDPPSYDERESFSPLMPDLTPKRSNRYQPSSHHPPPSCSCTAGYQSYPGPTPLRHRHSPHNLTPPAPSHSPGQAMPYPLPQPVVHPHRCRSDPQQIGYQPSPPKTNPVGSNQPSANFLPIHHAPPCPPHSSLVHACSAERPLQPAQHLDSRRPPVRQSPQPPGMTGASYCDPGHSYSPSLPSIDPQYLCGSQSLGASYGSEYGGDSSSLYSESTYGQAPRRVLLDPETGKYFYIEVPVQPLRKMLFDPEIGQYVEVLIPHHSVSHSGLYPPTAAPYPPLHNPNVYGPPQQYYAAPAPPPLHPPPQAHPQAQLQPPRYPEPSAPGTMHQSGSYRNTSGQANKSNTHSHPAMDQSYLESMYYVPTGMTASPNPTPPDYYHKHPPNLPPTGGKRS